MATYGGTKGNDTRASGSDNGTICGLGGDDVPDGGAGDDRIYGRNGEDQDAIDDGRASAAFDRSFL